ncbi:MAG: HD domain-containing protein [Actinomycetota bacterium]|nr:HD domain-containing protein [Actinomycetota bacterium]
MQATDARVLVLDERGDAGPWEGALRSTGYQDLHVTEDLGSAVELCRDLMPAVVLVDLEGPDFKGLQTLRDIAEAGAAENAVVVVVTEPPDASARAESLAFGATDFLTKPLDPQEVAVRLRNLLELHSLRHRVGEQTREAGEEIKKRTTQLWESLMQLEEARKELTHAQEETMARLSMAAEYRDDETPGHVERVSRYCALLAQANGAEAEEAEVIRLASRLHDIGKIGVSDLILLKEGILTPTERRMMEEHVPIGVRLLEGSGSKIIQTAAVVAGSHHERYDGTGYPRGLSGEDIPIEGRIAAIADVFDALSHNRAYRKAFPLGSVLEMMRDEGGRGFDPGLLEAFLDSMNTVLAIYEEHRESA